MTSVRLQKPPSATASNDTSSTVCVMIPVEKSMTILELKQAFIEASKAAASSEEDAVETKPANIKLFKQGVDSEGNESWVALDDKATVDRAGLDQGHVVGASFGSQGAMDLHVCEKPG